MERSAWRPLNLEPNLEKLEPAYQKHVFEFDAALVIFASVGFNALSLYFIISDYKFLGLSQPFYAAVSLRLILLTYSIWCCRRIYQNRPHDNMGMLAASLVVVGVLLTAFVNFSRPRNYLGYIPVNIMLLFSIYLTAPIPRKIRVMLAGAFTFFEIINLITKVIPVPDRSAIIVAYVFTNLLGAILSGYIFTYRRFLYIQLHERTENEQALRKLATIDSLTNVKNRRIFIEQGTLELERSKRYGHPLAIALIDMDGFKEINDKYGHHAGDDVLKSFAHLVDQNTREPDTFARLGGDEFGLLMPETSDDEARRVVERILRVCREASFPADGRKVKICISVGLTCRHELASLDMLMREADRALYQAKREGGNRAAWDCPSPTERSGKNVA